FIDAVTTIAHGIVDRLGPRDVAAFIGPVCQQAFTDDRDRLNAAIDAMRPGAPPCRQNVGRRSIGAFDPRGFSGDLLENVAEYLSVVPQRRKAIIYIGNAYNLGSGKTPKPDLGIFVNAIWLAQMANANIYAISPAAIGPLGLPTGPNSSDGVKALAEE